MAGIGNKPVILLSDGASNSCVVGTDEAEKYAENYGSPDEILTVHDVWSNDSYQADGRQGCYQTGTDCKYCDAANNNWNSRENNTCADDSADIKITEMLTDISEEMVEVFEIEDLIEAFESIEEQIEMQAQAWVVTDPMGENIGYIPDNNIFTSFNEETNTLMWNIKAGEEPAVSSDGDENALAGAEFTLTTADNTSWKMTAVSDENGVVSFTEIPSGHIYELKETSAPQGYIGDDEVHTLVVSYGEVTVDGMTAEDDGSI